MRREAKCCGGPITFSPTGTDSCKFVVPVSGVRRVWVNRAADGSEVEHVVFDSRFATSPVVGVWTGTEVSHWVKEYSPSERRTNYEALVTKAQHFGWS
eukprot:947159-Lingulodinium_polyedra.AAC.1